MGCQSPSVKSLLKVLGGVAESGYDKRRARLVIEASVVGPSTMCHRNHLGREEAENVRCL